MTTCVIGSLRNLARLQDIAEILRQKGQKVLVPIDTSSAHFADRVKTKNEFMKSMYEQIKSCDAVLVANDTPRGGLEGYIGPNTFLQLGMAMALDKRLYALAKWDKNLPYDEELEAMGINVIDIQQRF
ncbi:MAG: nucleoside 2-deoxyribosyltransferase [Patescibacteria group bacterium]|nr:nucleoside 2-deoxyribosyltransferase [Patescibacteria group bacterium]